MPRLTALKAEVGTTGSIVTLPVNPLTVEADISAAVREEHWCSDTDCDIREAWKAGFPLTAAYLLSGATETPLLDAVARYHEVDLSDFPADEWPGWKAHHDEWYSNREDDLS